MFNCEKKIKYSIRKLSIGAVSLAIGFSFFVAPLGLGQNVQAAEEAAVENVVKDKSVLENYLLELKAKDFSNKTEESLSKLNDLIAKAESVLENATSQKEIDHVYQSLVGYVNSGLRTKKVEKKEVVEEDKTAQGKKTVGQKAENTEPSSESNSISKTGENDPRNGQSMGEGEKTFAPTTGLAGNVTNETELQAQLNANNSNIILSNDITVTTSIHVPENYTGTIHGNGYKLTLNADVIDGMVQSKNANLTLDSITLDGQGKGRLIRVAGGKLTVKDSTFENGVSYNSNTGYTGGDIHGGAIYALSTADVDIQDSVFQNNSAVPRVGAGTDFTSAHGGAIYAAHAGTIKIRTTKFENNKVVGVNDTLGNGGAGGAITADYTTSVEISDSTFTGNHTGHISEAGNQGGAVRVDHTIFKSTNNTYNVARTFNTGGAIYAQAATVTIEGDTFKLDGLGDGFGISGGAIVSANSDTTINNSTFTGTGDSKVIHSGGLIDVVGSGTFNLKNSTLTGTGSWWNGPAMATFGGGVAFETDSTVTALIENTTISNIASDEHGGAIAVGTRVGDNTGVNLTLRNITINNARTRYAWKTTHGGAIGIGKGSNVTIEGGTISGGFSVIGGGIYNEGNLTLTDGAKLSGNTAYKYGGGIYNNGTLTVDEATLQGNFKTPGVDGKDENPGKTNEYAGGNIYAKKDVTITPKATIDEGDIRVLDQESAIVLTGALTQNLNVSISEAAGGDNNETPVRRVGYLVAKGDGTYTPTAEDAKKLHYLTRDTNDASAVGVHDDLGKWDNVLNPDDNTVVLGQRVKIVYHANGNAGDAKFTSTNSDTVEQVETIYKKGFVPQVISEKPTRDNFKFDGWETTQAGGTAFNVGTALGLDGSEITNLINPSTVHAYAKWLAAYKANYKFVADASTPAGVTFPQTAIDAFKPVDTDTYLSGENATPKQPTQTNYVDANNDGTWTFQSYDAATKQVNNANVEFVGTWKFTPNEHHVTYEFESDTPGKALPAAVNAFLPNDAAKYTNNQTVTALAPTQVTYVDNDLDGVWTFQGYDAPTKTVNKGDVKFVGKWTFKANEYNVSYEFQSDTAGKTLPAGVTNLLPTDPAKYITNDSVTAVNPNPTTVDDADLDGVWTFQGYDAATKTVNKADVKFVGKWTFKANEYNVSYEFQSDTAGKALPAGVTNLLPTDPTKYIMNDTVTALAPAQTTFADDVLDGVWTFQGYDADTKVVGKEDVKFVGKWTFKSNEYTVSYKSQSDTAGKNIPAGLEALLPTDPAKYIMNDTVIAKAPSKTTYADDVLDGVWTFQGYDADTKVVGKENVTFIAKWTFKSNEYTVSYESKSETPGKEVPEALKGLLPTDPAKYIMNDTVTAKAPSKTTYADDVLDGVWTFEGYDSATKLVGKENVKFFAKWSFVANKYKATYEFVSGTDGKVLPSSVLANLPEDVTEYINGQTVTAIKPATLTVQDPENNGTWTFVGYTEDSKVINKEGVKFVGTWTFKENDPELPNTGTASELGALSATIGAIFAGFGVSILRKKDSKDKA